MINVSELARLEREKKEERLEQLRERAIALATSGSFEKAALAFEKLGSLVRVETEPKKFPVGL